MDMADKTASAGVPLSIVLAPTASGVAELSHPAAGLSLSQRKLLARIDGRRSLASLVGTETGLTGERLSRDGLRLLALGLAHTDEAFAVPTSTTIMRALAETQSTLPPPETLPPQATPDRVVQPRRPGRAAWVWTGAAIASAVAVAALLWRTPSVPVPSNDVATNVAVPPAAAPALPPPPVQAVQAAAVGAVERPAAVEAAPAPVAPVPREVVPPQPKAIVAPERAPAKTGVAEARGNAPASPPKPPPTAAEAKPAPKNVQPERSPPPPQAAPDRAADTASAVLAAAPATNTIARPTPPPAAAGPRALLPQEREFGAVVADPEQLARQAAGLAPLQRTPPIFPRAAVKDGITEGAVRVRLAVAADGSVERVETSVSDPRHRVFESAARAAALTWTFVPGAAGRTHESVIQFRAP